MTEFLTEIGLQTKSLAQIKSEMEDSFREKFGVSIKLGPDTIFGKFIAIQAERESLQWEHSQEHYDARNPNSAFGLALDDLAALTGVSRNPAIRSRGIIYGAGSTGAVILARSRFEVEGALDQFEAIFESEIFTTEDFSIQSGGATSVTLTFSGGVVTATAIAHGLTTGVIVTVSGAEQGGYNGTHRITVTGPDTYTYTIASTPITPATGTITHVDEGLAQDPGGTTEVVVRAVSHGFLGSEIRMITGATQSDYNGVFAVGVVLDPDHFIFDLNRDFSATPATGGYAGKQANLIEVRSRETGPIPAKSHTLNRIVTPIAGLTEVDNLVDVTLGEDAETDAALRVRRDLSLQGLGNATIEAIRGDLLAVDGVSSVFVFQNPLDITVGIRTPHSVEAVVNGGANQDIFDELFDSKAAGIETVGLVTGSHVDSQGVTHSVSFSRPVLQDVWINLDLQTNIDYPTNGDDLVRQALLDAGATLNVGDDVIPTPFLVGAIATVPGITQSDIGVLVVPEGFPDPNPTPGVDTALIPIAETDLAVFDSGRIGITII